jgi:hypothetical protein
VTEDVCNHCAANLGGRVLPTAVAAGEANAIFR